MEKGATGKKSTGKKTIVTHRPLAVLHINLKTRHLVASPHSKPFPRFPGVLHPHPLSSLISACGTSVRISKIEMIGRKRMKRKRSEKNMPMVPMNIEKSNIVGV